MKETHAQRLDAESDPGFLAFCKQHARMCPACGVLIWRYAGCDHMSCRCGHNFNWTDADAQVGAPGELVGTSNSPPTAEGGAGQQQEQMRTDFDFESDDD